MPILTKVSVTANSTGEGDATTLGEKYPGRGWWTSKGGAFKNGRLVKDVTLTLTTHDDVTVIGVSIGNGFVNANGDMGAKTVVINGAEKFTVRKAKNTGDPQVLKFSEPRKILAGQPLTIQITASHGAHFVALKGIGLKWELKSDLLFRRKSFDGLEKMIGADYEAKGGKSIMWMRPVELFQTSTIALFDRIEPSDIKQGHYGNCWLVSALAALAEFPEELATRIDPKTYSATGKYTISLYDPKNDCWVPQEVDDRIACSEKDRSPIGARPEGQELWVLLYEKAVAQFAGDYTAIAHGGTPLWAMMVLCGSNSGLRYRFTGTSKEVDILSYGFPASPNKICDLDFYRETWPDRAQTKGCREFVAVLAEHDAKDHMMVAFTAHSETQEMHGSTDRGIFLTHAYSLLSVHRNVAGSDRDFVLLRNPHGHGEWEGPWGDKSPEWGSEHKIAKALKDVMASRADDGFFFMEATDFLEVFDYVDVVTKTMGKPAIQKPAPPRRRRAADTRMNSNETRGRLPSVPKNALSVPVEVVAPEDSSSSAPAASGSGSSAALAPPPPGVPSAAPSTQQPNMDALTEGLQRTIALKRTAERLLSSQIVDYAQRMESRVEVAHRSEERLTEELRERTKDLMEAKAALQACQIELEGERARAAAETERRNALMQELAKANETVLSISGERQRLQGELQQARDKLQACVEGASAAQLREDELEERLAGLQEVERTLQAELKETQIRSWRLADSRQSQEARGREQDHALWALQGQLGHARAELAATREELSKELAQVQAEAAVAKAELQRRQKCCFRMRTKPAAASKECRRTGEPQPVLDL